MDFNPIRRNKMALIEFGRTHVHTENSVEDALPTVENVAKRMAEMGAKACAITDHGTVSGWWSFEKACKKYGIKPVFGVEGYVHSPKGRLHIILLAKDNIGLKQISLLVTESNRHVVTSGKIAFPLMDKAMIESYVGPGTAGHDHVFGTSACIGGILAGLAIESKNAMKELNSIDEKLRMSDEQAEYCRKLQETMDQLKKEEEELKASITRGTAIKKRRKIAENKKDPEERERALAALDDEERRSEEAAEKWIDLERQRKTAKKNFDSGRKKIMSEQDRAKFSARKAELMPVALNDDELWKAMKEEAVDYDRIFGHRNFFIELQYHYDEKEKEWMPKLASLADSLSIPVIAANDEHMLNREDTETRKYLNSMRYESFKWMAPSRADEEVYFKSDEELTKTLSEILPIGTVNKAMLNIGYVLENCNASYESEEAYPKFEKSWGTVETNAYLEQLAWEGLDRLVPGRPKEYADRLTYELSIIEQMHYSDYFLIVRWYTNIGRMLGHVPEKRLDYLNQHLNDMSLDEILAYIQEDQSAPGYAVGTARGSGAGSLVNYVLGTTGIDPIRFNLIFERFLNPERVSMPDIDVDFAKFIRKTLIEIVRKKFGHDGVACIMTRNCLKAKAALIMTAKVYGSKTKGDAKAFLSLGGQLSGIIPNNPKACLDDYEGQIRMKFGSDPDAMAILDMAKKLEGIYITTGMHAAGVVIVDNGDIRQYTPLMWDPKKLLWKTQMDKDEVEKHKMLKMDFLGLINLDVITDCLRLIKSRHPEMPEKELDMEEISLDDSDALAIYKSADTDSVFQFESEGMKKILRQVKPQTFDDLVALNAIDRPGPMQFVPDIAAVKNGERKAEYLCPQLEPILKNTYGSILYQEQVMQIFRELAGYSLGGADLVRRAMGHKEEDILKKERKSFIYGDPERNICGCTANGIDPAAANKLFDQMMQFASYAFNRSHAVAYTKISFITAYLKAKFPVEYFCTIMAYEKQEKMPDLIAGCRKRGIDVLPPDINQSAIRLRPEGNRIYFGLGSVLGVANAASGIVQEREAHGQYKSVCNFLYRTSCKRNAFAALIKAGAFDSLGTCRANLLRHQQDLPEAVATMTSAMKKVKRLREIQELMEAGKIEEATEKNGGKKPGIKALDRSIAIAIEKYMSAKRITSCEKETEEEDNVRKLTSEKEVLGMYVSGSPLDGCAPVAQFADGRALTKIPSNGRIQILGFTTGKFERMSRNGNRYYRYTFLTPKGELDGICFNAAVFESLNKEEGPMILTGVTHPDNRSGMPVLTIYSADKPGTALRKVTVKARSREAFQSFSHECGRVRDPKYAVVQYFDLRSGKYIPLRKPAFANDEVLRRFMGNGMILDPHYAN